MLCEIFEVLLLYNTILRFFGIFNDYDIFNTELLVFTNFNYNLNVEELSESKRKILNGFYNAKLQNHENKLNSNYLK